MRWEACGVEHHGMAVAGPSDLTSSSAGCLRDASSDT